MLLIESKKNGEDERGLTVPIIKQNLVVLGRLDPENVYVSTSVPSSPPSNAVVAVESETAEDDGSLSHPTTKREGQSRRVSVSLFSP